jgi:ADP-heptose:LPS heptosyltransferase
MEIIISPFSRNLDTSINAKNFPLWKEVVASLKERQFKVVQVGLNNEELIGADEVQFNQPLSELAKRVSKCVTWASVDNFFHHFATYHQRRGVVIFGKSDPAIFGHSINLNLLKDRKYLRPDQYNIWAGVPHDPQVFVSPEIVVNAILSLANASRN